MWPISMAINSPSLHMGSIPMDSSMFDNSPDQYTDLSSGPSQHLKSIVHARHNRGPNYADPTGNSRPDHNGNPTQFGQPENDTNQPGDTGVINKNSDRLFTTKSKLLRHARSSASPEYSLEGPLHRINSQIPALNIISTHKRKLFGDKILPRGSNGGQNSGPDHTANNATTAIGGEHA